MKRYSLKDSLRKLMTYQPVPLLGLALALAALGDCAGGEENDPPESVAEAQDAVTSPIRIAYESDPLQFGDLRIPSGPGPHPVAVVIHGGCWLNIFGLDLMDDMSDVLTDAGLATWNIEYRRLGDPGGGFPNTLTDVGMAVDKVRDLAPTYDLDLSQVIPIGHSAGGHLGFWAAARQKLPSGDPLRGADPLPLDAAVSLAGILNLAEGEDLNVCSGLIPVLMGGTPEEVPERYAKASPSELLPLGLPQSLIHANDDPIVPLEMSEHYRKAARDAGDDDVKLKKIPHNHFSVIDPAAPEWPKVFKEILRAFK